MSTSDAVPSTSDWSRVGGRCVVRGKTFCKHESTFLLVRQNSRHYVDSRSMEQTDPEVEMWRSTSSVNPQPIDDVIVVQDECIGLLPLAEILRRVAPPSSSLPLADSGAEKQSAMTSLPPSPLTGLYVVDCRLDIDDDEPLTGQCVAETSPLPGPSGGPSMQPFESLVNLRE